MPRADKAPHHPLHDKGADDIPAPHMQGIRAHALIFADAYPEANATPVGFLSSIRGKEKNTSKHRTRLGRAHPVQTLRPRERKSLLF